MADFLKALAITLKNEGGFFSNPKTGEIVNMGITADFLASNKLLPLPIQSAYTLLHSPGSATPPELATAKSNIEDYVSSLTRRQVTGIYLKYFWYPVRGDSLLAQPIANKLFDVDVNQGGIARWEMQGAVNDLTPATPNQPPLELDGVLGPVTL